MFGKKTKNKKILKVEYPLLTCYPHIANILAIYGINPYIETLMLSELSELVFDKKYDRLDFSIALDIDQYMKNYPLCYTHGLSREFIEKNWRNPIDFIKASINDGYYVQMLVDTYYISVYKNTYEKQHYLHDIMIYGYDEKEEIFYVADCFVNGKYEFATSGFGEIEASYLRAYNGDWLYGVRLTKIKEEQYMGIGYNPYYMIDACKRYLNNEKSSAVSYLEGRRRYDMDERFVHGIQIYDELINYIEDYEAEEGWNSYDVKIFFVLYDHIKVFRHITKQLMQRSQIINTAQIYERFLNIENQIKNLYMNVMKYNITGSEKLRNDLKDKLLEIKKCEREAIELFIESIDISKADMEKERPLLVKRNYIEADSIFVEYADANSWKKKSINDKIIYTNVKEAYAKAQFYGTGVKLDIVKKKINGQAEVYIDGIEKRVIDYSDGDGKTEVVIDGLELGYHIIRLKNISQNGENINLGKIEILNISDEEKDVLNQCKLIDIKSGNCSNLIKNYGSSGYDIMCARRKLPEYLNEVNYITNNAIFMSLIYDKADKRGIAKSKDADERIAAYAFSETDFWFEITIPGKAREVGFYSVDYDYFDRKMDITVEDADTGKILYSQRVEKFTDGIFIQFLLKGHVFVRYKNVEGPDAVVSAVLFD